MQTLYLGSISSDLLDTHLDTQADALGDAYGDGHPYIVLGNYVENQLLMSDRMNNFVASDVPDGNLDIYDPDAIASGNLNVSAAHSAADPYYHVGSLSFPGKDHIGQGEAFDRYGRITIPKGTLLGGKIMVNLSS